MLSRCRWLPWASSLICWVRCCYLAWTLSRYKISTLEIRLWAARFHRLLIKLAGWTKSFPFFVYSKLFCQCRFRWEYVLSVRSFITRFLYHFLASCWWSILYRLTFGWCYMASYFCVLYSSFLASCITCCLTSICTRLRFNLLRWFSPWKSK